ncbi:MAG TPA: Fur family transcriptional regulator [Phycisphaerae bacterium]|nr:Fur family transcriptional regulator [Phycisphaerae bacterium]
MADPSMERMLQRAKLRKTPARMGVLGILSEATAPLGASDILGKMPPHADSVTVYRTLNSLVKKGIIHRVRGEDRIWRYAVSEAKESHAQQHPHFICDGCGRIECVKEVTFPGDFLKLLKTNKRRLVTYAEVMLHGTCPKCQ